MYFQAFKPTTAFKASPKAKALGEAARHLCRAGGGGISVNTTFLIKQITRANSHVAPSDRGGGAQVGNVGFVLYIS